ncbi:MAG: hypothetical protein J1D86_07720 [Alistipes sp.]|nr:hypothetical protein [Alistipes sp.]
MNVFLKIAILAAAAILSVSCRRAPLFLSDDGVAARVGDARLEMSEVQRSVPENYHGADSAAFAQLYVDRWVRRMLKVREAEQMFKQSAQDIDRQVEEFRQSLLVRKLERSYVDSATDSLITDCQVREYYQAHIADFKLDRTLVKGRIVRFPESYRRAVQLYALMSSPSEAKQRDFDDICAKNDFRLVDERSAWVDFADFLSELPVTGTYGASLLVTGKVQNLRDTYSIYYLEITDILRPGDTMPFERAEPIIRRILDNARRNEIIRRHEQELISAARERRDIKIYENKD